MWRHFLHLLDSHAPAIQGISAFATLVVSGVLTGITFYYARVTGKAYALNREQFDREWDPRIHVQNVRHDTATIVEAVTNLGRAAVVLTGLEMSIMGKTALVVIDQVLSAGARAEYEWITQIISVFNSCGYGPGQFSFEGEVGLRVRFESLGKVSNNSWQTIKVKVQDGRFVKFSV